MEFQTFDVIICSGNKKHPIENKLFTWIFVFKFFMFPLQLLTVDVQKIFVIPQYVYHKLAKFDKYWRMQTTQNLNLFDKNPVYYVNHF